MFSYRHSFHAGNHADVLKHTILIALLEYLLQKPKALMVIDTHAGAGAYDLHGTHATQSQEWHEGLGKLLQQTRLHSLLKPYLDLIKKFNGDANSTAVQFYPGSPSICASLLRPQDALHLFELHSTDFPVLNDTFAGQQKNKVRVHVQKSNGFAALKALLPPLSRRGLVLIDPSYEDKQDYAATVEAVNEGLKRFATGTYMVWYPCLARKESRQLPEQLKCLPHKNWLRAELAVADTTKNPLTRGLTRSGVFVINPPWTLKAMLEQVLPSLTEALRQDDGAEYLLEEGEAEV